MVLSVNGRVLAASVKMVGIQKAARHRHGPGRGPRGQRRGGYIALNHPHSDGFRRPRQSVSSPQLHQCHRLEDELIRLIPGGARRLTAPLLSETIPCR